MVAGVAGLAAGSPAHLRFLRLMTPRAAFREGIRRVNAAPMVLAGMFAVTLAGGAAALLRAARHDCGAPGNKPRRRRGGGGDELRLVAGVFGAGSRVWARRSFRRSPASAPCSTISADSSINVPLATTVVGVTAAWLMLWSFLAGGVIDRFARARRTRAHGFFAACGMHFWRLLRLGIVAWLAYGFLFRYVHSWIFAGAYPWLTKDVTVERSAFAVRLGAYLVFGALLILCNIVFDYARVRIVVEDRRSALGAILAGGRFVRRHLADTLSLYVLNAAAFIALIARLCAGGAGRPAVRAVDVACVRRRRTVHRGKALLEAAVLRIGDRLLPGCARARGLHCSASAGMA